MHLHEFANFLTTMFAITNPFGNLAIFIGLTSHRSKAAQHKVALTTAVATVIIFLLITWIGQALLSMLSISISAFEMAGGIIITLIGLSMLSSKKSEMSHTESENKQASSKENIAVVPLAIPIIAGPGAMTAILVSINKYPHLMARVYISFGDILIAAFIGLTFYFAGPISKLLGESGIKIAIRITGLILVAMAMGMLTTGLGQALPGLLK